MFTIRETDLPGIGHKFLVETRRGERLVVVVHDDGRRELYHFSRDEFDEGTLMVTLDDDEARRVAGIIGGMVYTPRALETMEVGLDQLMIEWYTVTPDAPCAGKSIGELRVRQECGATIIAIIGPGREQQINPGPDRVLTAGSTIVVVGQRGQVRALERQLLRRSP